ncbi:MAG: hypothetical protein PGN26_03090 [Xylophilus ampelinus]
MTLPASPSSPASPAAPPDWWDAVSARAAQAPAEPRAPLRIDGQPVGSIARPLLALLRQAGLPLEDDPGGANGPDGPDGGAVRPAGDPTDALGRIAG